VYIKLNNAVAKRFSAEQPGAAEAAPDKASDERAVSGQPTLHGFNNS
jgi:hypothetical protein